jgi:hypothetical protein
LKKAKSVLLAVLWCAAAGADVPRPNFSGTWKLNTDKSTQDGPRDRSYVVAIVQEKASIQVTTKATPPPPGVILDGTFKIVSSTAKPQIEKLNGHLHSTRVFFENTTLVFEIIERETTNPKSKATSVIRESWVLSPDGKTLTKFRQTPGVGKTVDQKYVFEKQ